MIVPIPVSIKKKINDHADNFSILKEEKKVVTINLEPARPSIIVGANSTDRTPRRPPQLEVE